MRWLLLMPLVMGFAPPQPLMGYVDAAKLAEFCAVSGASGSGGNPMCQGYVAGSVDQLMAQQAPLPPEVRTVCVPEGVTIDDAVAVVRTYSGWANSAARVGAAGFVKVAMERAYPCSRRAAEAPTSPCPTVGRPATAPLMPPRK